MSTRMGLGDAVVTPPLGVRIAGYFHERLVTGVHDDLHVKALAASDGSGTVIQLCFDLICLEASRVEGIRRAVSAATGILAAATESESGGT